MCSLYNGILFSKRKEQVTSTFYNTDEPQEHYAKKKKLDTNGIILNDFI